MPGGFEFTWACGPPMGNESALLRFIDSKQVTRDFRRSVMACGCCPPFLKQPSQPRDRKYPPKSRTSFIGHPSAMKFLQISRVWVFQQPRLSALTIVHDTTRL